MALNIKERVVHLLKYSFVYRFGLVMRAFFAQYLSIALPPKIDLNDNHFHHAEFDAFCLHNVEKTQAVKGSWDIRCAFSILKRNQMIIVYR